MSILIFSSLSYGYSAYELFNGRHPHSRKEAMGKTGVASNGFLYANLSNPAAIGEIDGFYLNYSNDPERDLFFQNKDVWYSEYYGFAVGYKEFSFAVEYYQQRWRKDYRTSPTGEIEGIIENRVSKFNFIGSYEIIDNLYFGSALRYSIIENYDETNKAYSIDLGIIQKVDVLNIRDINYSLNIGVSLSNVLNAYHKDWGHGYKEGPPSNLRLGVNNNIDFNDNSILNSIKFNTEINKIVSARPQLEFGFYNGLEINLVKYFLLRGGYYYEAYDRNDQYFSEFTYGFGLKLPLYEIFKNNSIPIDLEFGYTPLNQPILNNTTYYGFENGISSGDLGPFTSYSIVFKWRFDK